MDPSPGPLGSKNRRSKVLRQAAWVVAFLGTVLAFLLGLSALTFSNAFGADLAPLVILPACAIAFGLLWISARRIFRDTWPD
ncbi:MAG: hypothetical protein GEU78_12670 [Actinobacteria bacterium]|nr:hypothetical protein [Actinomycetota bacterium]